MARRCTVRCGKSRPVVSERRVGALTVAQCSAQIKSIEDFMPKGRKPRKRSRDMEELVGSYLRNQALEDAENYIKRGRHLSKVDTRKLKDQWIHAFRRMVAAVQSRERDSSADRQNRMDIEAELLIRKVDLPYTAVKKDVVAFSAAAQTATNELQRDPLRLSQIESELQDDLSAFEAKGKTSPKN
jgi:hypothetical protein